MCILFDNQTVFVCVWVENVHIKISQCVLCATKSMHSVHWTVHPDTVCVCVPLLICRLKTSSPCHFCEAVPVINHSCTLIRTHNINSVQLVTHTAPPTSNCVPPTPSWKRWAHNLVWIIRMFVSTSIVIEERPQPYNNFHLSLKDWKAAQKHSKIVLTA